jgi:hypothetical protein
VSAGQMFYEAGCVCPEIPCPYHPTPNRPFERKAEEEAEAFYKAGIDSEKEKLGSQ